MVKNKLLSLAVPSYNMEQYLTKCINSCVCENMQYLDIIIVNDGSKDSTLELANNLAAEYPEIVRVVDKENGHYGSCVNAALEIAEGKYFRMLDPDDWCDTAALNDLLERMKDCDADLILTASNDLFLGKKLITNMSLPSEAKEGFVYDVKDFDGIKLGAKYLYCSHCLTYKTSILRSIGLKLQSGICYTDNEYVFYPLDRINTIVCFNLPVYQYYIGREGASTTDSRLKMQREMWQVLKGIFDYFEQHKQSTIVSVQNNQRILIAEIVFWIYSATFFSLNPVMDEERKILNSVQDYVDRDKRICDMVKAHFYALTLSWTELFMNTRRIKEYKKGFFWWFKSKAYLKHYIHKVRGFVR